MHEPLAGDTLQLPQVYTFTWDRGHLAVSLINQHCVYPVGYPCSMYIIIIKLSNCRTRETPERPLFKERRGVIKFEWYSSIKDAECFFPSSCKK